MILKHEVEDVEALQTVMNNVKRALHYDAEEKVKTEEVILHSDVKQEHVESTAPNVTPPPKVNAKKGISYKIKEIRRTLIHLLCGSGLFKNFHQDLFIESAGRYQYGPGHWAVQRPFESLRPQ